MVEIILYICSLTLLIVTIFCENSDDRKLFTLMFIIVLVMSITFTYTRGYKNGQINAANGKMEYQLEKQEDGTVEWKLIEKK